MKTKLCNCSVGDRIFIGELLFEVLEHLAMYTRVLEVCYSDRVQNNKSLDRYLGGAYVLYFPNEMIVDDLPFK